MRRLPNAWVPIALGLAVSTAAGCQARGHSALPGTAAHSGSRSTAQAAATESTPYVPVEEFPIPAPVLSDLHASPYASPYTSPGGMPRADHDLVPVPAPPAENDDGPMLQRVPTTSFPARDRHRAAPAPLPGLGSDEPAQVGGIAGVTQQTVEPLSEPIETQRRLVPEGSQPPRFLQQLGQGLKRVGAPFRALGSRRAAAQSPLANLRERAQQRSIDDKANEAGYAPFAAPPERLIQTRAEADELPEIAEHEALPIMRLRRVERNPVTLGAPEFSVDEK